MELFDPKKEKYITKGIDAEIPVDYQIKILNSIENWRQQKIKLDYLQVFKLSVEKDCEGKNVQVILHSQEIPEHSEKIKFQIEDEGIETKIFVIDNDDFCTMLLSTEY